MPRPVRIAGTVLGALLVLLLLALAGIYGFSQPSFNRPYVVDPAPLAGGSSGTPEEMAARGEHIVTTRGCMDCHGVDLAGKVIADDPVVGTIWGANLTSGAGGAGGRFEERDWVRAIRHGIGADGKPLMLMPSHEFWGISDADVASMIAYLESLPAVDRIVPAPKPGPLARLLFLTGKMPLVAARLVDHDAPRPLTPPKGSTVEYGGYLAAGCVGCHGFTMSGGPVPGAPPGFGIPANVTPDMETGLGTWAQADFVRAMREGISRDGRTLDPTMPVQFTREFTDMELEAIWKYLQSLEPRPFGNR